MERREHCPGGLTRWSLERENATYERLRDTLEAEHLSEWALIRGETYVGAFPTFEAAVREAGRRSGRGPFLIREIGAPLLRFPGSDLKNTFRAIR